ncbi:MAG: PGPGW domain-containing protein [Thermoleophilaceae bacterium]|nr:PGPGW domain-containing protein [Thermoleophilaceae bacterium]
MTDRSGEEGREARSGSGRREPPKLVRRLQRRRDSYRQRGLVYRIAWVTAAVIVVVAGLAMVVFPGPALVVIPIGLAMLSLEFAWAQRLLDTTLERGLEAKDIALGANRRQQIVGGVAIVCGIAAVAAVALIYFV